MAHTALGVNSPSGCGAEGTAAMAGQEVCFQLSSTPNDNKGSYTVTMWLLGARHIPRH